MNRTRPLLNLDLNVTNRCNLRCVHCAFDSGCRKYSEMSLAGFGSILEAASRLGCTRVDITGGEPLLRDDIGPLVSIGKSYGLAMKLITNGILLEPRVVADLKARGLDSMAISLDGPDHETHARIRTVSRRQYRQTLKAIDSTLEAGIPLKINSVAFASNYRRLPELTRWCVMKGIKEHGICPFTPMGRGSVSAERPVDPGSWLAFITSLAGASPQVRIAVKSAYFPSERCERHMCVIHSGCDHLQILPNGDVCPCALMAAEGLAIANVQKISLPQIWNDPMLWYRYRKSLSGRISNGSCIKPAAEANGWRPICPERKIDPAEL